MNPDEYTKLDRLDREHWFYRGKRAVVRHWIGRHGVRDDKCDQCHAHHERQHEQHAPYDDRLHELLCRPPKVIGPPPPAASWRWKRAAYDLVSTYGFTRHAGL